jgi:NAD+ synthase (glutamine-hydrolysing)
MSSIAVVATCNLNQWAMDFTGNLERIRQSIAGAREAGATLRLGPELEISGYGCEDHFLEEDTTQHSWEVLAELLSDGSTDNMLCDFGMPVTYHGVRYNCRVICLNGDILLIRPKLFLANDGNYRETRWFTRWSLGWVLKEYPLPGFVVEATRSKKLSVPIGPGMIQCLDTVVASETCEELFTPNSPHITLALNGAEIITNGSGSHHNLRKLDRRLKLITDAVEKSGGVYMYANQIGCDGGRLYYDGCALVCDNGHILAQGSQFSLNEVEVITAAVELSRTRSFRGSFLSRCEQVSLNWLGLAAWPVLLSTDASARARREQRKPSA